MAKKKKYVPKEDDDWDLEADAKHRKIIKDKETAIRDRYKKFWDQKNGRWKDAEER